MTMLGLHHSPETRMKISKANMGYNNGFFVEYNRTHIRKGKDSYSWKGGKDRFPNCPVCNKKLSSLKSSACGKHKKACPKKAISSMVKNEKKHLDSVYRHWMRDVKNRDGWKCRLLNNDCRGRLESHHIFNWMDYPELRYLIENGITLCLVHHPRGRTKEKQMIPIFQELLLVSKE